jgi:predicted signal transduction protein with EAL and GGDEF domain
MQCRKSCVGAMLPGGSDWHEGLWRPKQHATHEISVKALLGKQRLTGIIVVAFTLLAVKLFPYAGIFCLMHLRSAVYTITFN